VCFSCNGGVGSREKGTVVRWDTTGHDMVMASGHRYNKRTESLPNTLSNALMFGNGQINHEENPNYLVYKKVSKTFGYECNFSLLK